MQGDGPVMKRARSGRLSSGGLGSGPIQLEHLGRDSSRLSSIYEADEKSRPLLDAPGDGSRSSTVPWMANVVGALLSCFLTATGGISLGTVIFPPGVEARWLSIGMSVGLLTAFVGNTVLAIGGTRLPVAVSGTLIPAITVLSDYMEREIGPDEPDTILMALAINTFCFGALVSIAGKAGINAVVRACPYAVFVGFLAYTGLSLLVYACAIIVPGFPHAPLEGKASAQLLPPVVVATLVALWRRPWSWKPPLLVRMDAYVVPLVALGMTVAFYACYLGGGGTLTSSREQGWVYAAATAEQGRPAVPGTAFVTVWTSRSLSKVQWGLIFQSEFVLLVLKTFAIGLLTLVEDAFATLQVCASLHAGTADVSIDDEVQYGGYMNMALALVGGMPSNIVFSYSTTVARMGACGRSFYALQAALSLLFFAYGDETVSVMPKMVPSFLLFWIGLELSTWALWDLRPHPLTWWRACGGTLPAEPLPGEATPPQLSRRSGRWTGAQEGGASAVVQGRPGFDLADYGVVVTMAMTGLLLGDSGLMMLVGILFALLITLWRLRNTSIVHAQGSLLSFHSLCTRTGKDAAAIERHGARTQVLVLAATSLSFHNVATLADVAVDVVHRATAAGQRVCHLLIDFTLVLDLSFDANQTFHELLELAGREHILLIFTGLSPRIAHALFLAGVPMALEAPRAPLARDRAQACVLCATCGQVFLDADGEQRGAGEWADLNTALVACEDDLLLAHKPAGANVTDASYNRSQDASQEAIHAALPHLNGHAAMPVLTDMYNWSTGYLPQPTVFDIHMLAVLARFLEVREYDAGDPVYQADWDLPREEGTFVPHPLNIPPLIWLLHGAIEHRWGHGGPKQAMGRTPAKIATNYGKHHPGAVIEYAELHAASAGVYCVGPMSTQTGFFGMFPHPGAVVAVAAPLMAGDTSRIRCAILTRPAYDSMRQEHPDVANLVQAHCARKRFDGLTKSAGNVGTPKLVV